MGLFDAFSADDETRKFEQGLKYQTGQIGQADNKIDQNFELARGDLRAGQTAGVGYLQDQNAIARGDLTGNVGTADGIYDQALSPWQQLSGMGQRGIDAHWNLTQNPDSIYDSELYKSREQGTLDALARGWNSRGMNASGNHTIDIINKMREGGLDYFKSLAGEYAPYFGLASGAATGIGNILGQKAGMYERLGQNLANGANQLGSNLSNVATGTGTQLADNRQTQGGLLNANRLTQGQAGADMNMNSANAGNVADANLWGAILGGTKLASGIYAA
jgi:hypothetical protein